MSHLSVEAREDISRYYDLLITLDCAFAFYRLPHSEEIVLLLQESTEPLQFSDLTQIGSEHGFLFAPFKQNAAHPIVLIKDDYVVTGLDNIALFLQEKVAKRRSGGTTHCTVELSSKELMLQSEEQQFANYEKVFANFLRALQDKQYEKLVLSRSCDYPLPQNFNAFKSFIKACHSYPNMMVSLCHTKVTGTWLGATPEIILKGEQDKWETVALAGTMPCLRDEDLIQADQWSDKNRQEQAVVSRYIADILSQYAANVTEQGPFTARAAKVMHLKTEFSFALRNNDSFSNLLSALHPTPAVCGLPKASSYQFILENECYDRAYYSGIIGPLNLSEQTNLYVNLRCMRLDKHHLTLYAGGGLLTQSTVLSEFDETKHKMSTMLSILS